MTTNTEPNEKAVEAVLFADYCRSCVEGRGCARLDVLTEPDSIKWDGPGTPVTATYECDSGHRWTCRWSPEYLPLHPNPEG